MGPSTGRAFLVGPANAGAGFGKAYLGLALSFLLFVVCDCNRNSDDIRRQEVVEGGSFTLTCYAQSSKLKAYRWVYIRAGTQRPQVLSSGRRLVVGEPRISLESKPEGDTVALELTFSDVRPYESGLFMCWRQGQKPDPQVLITVLEPGTAPEKQVIRYSEGPSEVKFGNSATFFCIITPPWPVKVTWYKNGEEIDTSDRFYTQNVERTSDPVGDRQIQEEKLVATLTVTSVRRDSVFSCRIDSDPPDQTDMPVKVLVPRVESLTTDPDKDIVEYGQPLAITCVVSGTDSEILWLKDGSKLAFGPHTPGREIYASAEDANRFGSTVYIESMTFRDNGHYVCYIPGASRNILINIEGRTPRLLGVTGGDFFEDETLVLRCSMQYLRHSQPGNFRWQYEGAELDPNFFQVKEYQTEYNVTVHELSVPKANEDNSGTYECITPYGTASISVNMFVPPSLGEPLPSEVRVREGDTIQVSCKAVGSPPPIITWEKRIGTATEKWVPVDNAGGVEVGANGELRIPAASMGDSGNYRCAAQSEAGSFLADVIVNVIRAGPEVFDIIAPPIVIVGDNFTVQCTVINWDGEVDFKFHKASVNSLDNSRYQVDSYPTEEGMTQVYLTIKDATLEDAGPYSCNAGAYASSSTVVEVHDRPAEVLDIFASPAITGRDFFITCIVLNGPNKVSFHKDGVQLPEHEGSRYTVQSTVSSLEEMTHILKVTSARAADQGVYECVADELGRSSLSLVVEAAKDEVLSVEASSAIIGRDFNITCTVKEWDGEVTFIHNNVVVDSNKDWRYDVHTQSLEAGDNVVVHTLVVSGVTENDSGTYECYTTPQTYRSVEVTVWDLVEVDLELTVKDRPNWRDSPIPINCRVDGVDPDSVTVLFSHFDNPQVSIQNRTKMATSDHLVNIAISENEPRIAGSFSTTFTLGFYTLSSDLSGIWSCQVMLPSGHILGDDTLYLEIEEPPEFVEKIPEEVQVDSDQDLVLNCSTRGSPEVVVSWHNAGIPEPIERRPQSATLFIPAFTAMDAGDYYCSATFLDREIRAKTKLVLRTPKPRVVSVTSEPVILGENIVVNCSVSYWTGQVLFLHNSESVDSTTPNSRYSTRKRSHGRREPNVVTHTLLIKDSTMSDNGLVECFISLDEFGSTNVTVLKEGEVYDDDDEEDEFDFEREPVTVELRGPDSVQEGGTLTLTCIVSSGIHQDVILVHDSTILHAGGTRITHDTRSDVVTDLGPDGSKFVYLTIREVTRDDSGNYQCSTLTEPPVETFKEVTVLSGVPVTPEEPHECGSYLTCGDCVTAKPSCRWHLGRHRCFKDLEEGSDVDAIIYGQDEGFTQRRSGKENCPAIARDPPEILVPKGRSWSVNLDSKNIGEEKTFDDAKFQCQFMMEGHQTAAKGRLWYDHIYCNEVVFDYFSDTDEFHVPVSVFWGEEGQPRYVDNPDDVHVKVYSCRRKADTCDKCQALAAKYRCGWCGLSNSCEFHSDCPEEEMIQPGSSCEPDAPSEKLTLIGPPEMEIFARPSDKVILPCTAGVSFDMEAGYWTREYDISWVRVSDDEMAKMSENSVLDISSYDRPRFSLDTDAGWEEGQVTKYDLVIDPVQVGDFGLYKCVLSDRKKGSVSKVIVLSVEEGQVSYDRCEFPDQWRGHWHATYDDFAITGTHFGSTECTASLKNKYLLKNEDYGCNMCFIINEKHPNLLEYKESPCMDEEDLNTLCSLVDDFNLTLLKKKNAASQCPFPSRRTFTYRNPDEECEELPSTMISGRNNTELVFWYQPCTGSEDNYYSSKVDCIATWREGDNSYLMGKLEKLPDRPERYKCFTYKEVQDEDHMYEMNEARGETCVQFGENFDKSYKIFDAAIAWAARHRRLRVHHPGDRRLLHPAEVFQLRGFPLATLRWLRNGQEITSARRLLEDRSEAVISIQVGPYDDGVQYSCEATNTATTSPLTVSTVLTFSRDECQMPTEWAGKWYEVTSDRYVDITQFEFSNSPCSASLGQNYLLHDKRKECNRCVIITEKHPNILTYRRSRCKPLEDLGQLCTEVMSENHTLVRIDGVTRCPWDGSRSFTYQTPYESCSQEPSQMYSLENTTELMMLYNPCVEQSGPDVAPRPERLRCVADWSDDNAHRYFMGKLVTDEYSTEIYRCFTYQRDEDGRKLFRASRVGTGVCSPTVTRSDAEYTYDLFGLSEDLFNIKDLASPCLFSSPQRPNHRGLLPKDTVQVGDTLHLKCVTYGGFPHPKVQWYREGEAVESRGVSVEERHEAEYSLVVTESDKGSRYQCVVSNYVTKPKLSVSVTLMFQGEVHSMLKEPRETHQTVMPSYKVTMNCTAMLSMNIEQYWDLPFKMRWVYYPTRGEPRSLSDMHLLQYNDGRFSLDIANMEKEDMTQYNLVLDPARLTDEGIYECHMWDEVQTYSHQVHLKVAGTPEYVSCDIPNHWSDKWTGQHEEYQIKGNEISGKLCEKSVDNRYLLRNQYHECNQCIFIEEKHPNLLRIKESRCSEEEDLAILCSMIDYDWSWLVRHEASTQCPFQGRPRPFGIRGSGSSNFEGCNGRPNKLFLDREGSLLVFEHHQCSDQLFQRNSVQEDRVDCLATWSEGSTHHLMGTWHNSLDPSQEELRCYTYSEVDDAFENHAFDLSHSGSRTCGPLHKAPERSFKVYDESVAPGKPVIQGYDPAEHREVGNTLTLTCTSRGGFPPAVLRWFRGKVELPADFQSIGNATESKLEVEVEEEEIVYRCEASNMATPGDEPLVGSIAITSLKGVTRLMRAQVSAVEGQDVFIPCGQILEPNLELEWYDADLDIKLTSGNKTLVSNDSLSDEPKYVPYLKGDLFGLIIKSGFLDTNYGCVVEDQKVGNTTLTILPAFLVTRQDYDISEYFEKTDTMVDANHNSVAKLNCTLKPGIKPVTVSWRREPSSALVAQDDISLAEEDGFAVEQNGSSYILKIRKSNLSHSGEYACQIIVDSEVFINNYTLTVQDVLKGNLSSETRIPCLAPVDLPVSFVFKEDVITKATHAKEKYDWEQEDAKPGANESLTTLIIRDTEEEDAGVYICVSEEDNEEVIRKINLGFASEVMLNVSNLRVVEATGTDIEIAWDPPTGDPFANIELYEVMSFKKGEESNAVTHVTRRENYLFLFLEEEVEYGFRVRVKTDMGWGAFTNPTFHKTGKLFEEDIGFTTPASVDDISTSSTDATTATREEEVVPPAGEVFPAPEATPEEEKKLEEDEYYEGEEFEYYYDPEKEEDLVPGVTYEKVVLSCGSYKNVDDLTWKRGRETLILAGLDIAGIKGLSSSPDGDLVLAEGPVKDIRDNDTYTCYHLDKVTFEDVPVVSYHVHLDGEKTTVETVPVEEEQIPTTPPSIQLKLVEKIAVLANSERGGRQILEILQSGGLDVRLLDSSKCKVTDVRGWDNAGKAIQKCEAEARQSGDLTEGEGIFIGIDFFVELAPSSWFAVTQLYLHNMEKHVSVFVFTPMVPVPAQDIIESSDPSKPDLIQVTDTWWNTVQGVNKSGGSGLMASILSLQESYLNRIKSKSL
ncbi:uncharacterized protein [Macrobrachium rosenbergii]|uniref:uncharacterized protein n=1 Tax=Macrobrachium rosenbergii TaxID=79674 RepID=UPI0034D45A7A